MTTIVTINAGDQITNSRSDLNTNFTNLNANKIETSAIDTDTALTANSDSKIPSQKAVKAYVDAGGNVNASETARGIVEEATDAEVTAGTATGATGAKLIVTPAKLATFLSSANYHNKVANGATTYDLSTASGAQNIAHGLGVAPKMVKITAIYSSGSTNASSAVTAKAYTVYSNSTQSSNYIHHTSASSATGNNSESGSTFTVVTEKASKYQTGVVTVTSTNIVITWTKTSTPTGTAYIVWEAIA